jgi:hypothetical protein
LFNQVCTLFRAHAAVATRAFDSSELRAFSISGVTAGDGTHKHIGMHSVSHEGVDKAFFTSPDLHQKIAEAGLKIGDEFKISKVAVQNGKKVTAKINFEVVAKATAAVPRPADGVPFEIPDDGFRDVMERSLRDAIEATKAVNTVP